jgi:hypothetical protein
MSGDSPPVAAAHTEEAPGIGHGVVQYGYVCATTRNLHSAAARRVRDAGTLLCQPSSLEGGGDNRAMHATRESLREAEPLGQEEPVVVYPADVLDQQRVVSHLIAENFKQRLLHSYANDKLSQSQARCMTLHTNLSGLQWMAANR